MVDLNALGLTMDAAGLVKAQTMYFELAPRLNEAVASVKGKTSEALDKLREGITEEDSKRAENVRDAFYAEANSLTGEDRAKFFLAVIDALENLTEFAEASASEFVNESLQENAKDSLASVASDYETAIALREAANTLIAALGQFGVTLPKEVKLTERKVRGGATATVLDWPKISDPSKIDVAKGKRSYTTKLPVFTVDGNEFPHGTNVRKIAVDHVSTEEKPIIAADLLTALEKGIGKDYRKTGGTIELNGRKITVTEWRPVGEENEENEATDSNE